MHKARRLVSYGAFGRTQYGFCDKSLAGQNEVFQDICLNNTLRCLGYKIPYIDHGPFWAQAEGNRFLAPYGCCKLLQI